MIEAHKLAAAQRLRALLDQGARRKAAILQVRQEFKDPATGELLGRATLYRYCKRAGISTK